MTSARLFTILLLFIMVAIIAIGCGKENDETKASNKVKVPPGFVTLENGHYAVGLAGTEVKDEKYYASYYVMKLSHVDDDYEPEWSLEFIDDRGGSYKDTLYFSFSWIPRLLPPGYVYKETISPERNSQQIVPLKAFENIVKYLIEDKELKLVSYEMGAVRKDFLTDFEKVVQLKNIDNLELTPIKIEESVDNNSLVVKAVNNNYQDLDDISFDLYVQGVAGEIVYMSEGNNTTFLSIPGDGSEDINFEINVPLSDIRVFLLVIDHKELIFISPQQL